MTTEEQVKQDLRIDHDVKEVQAEIERISQLLVHYSSMDNMMTYIEHCPSLQAYGCTEKIRMDRYLRFFKKLQKLKLKLVAVQQYEIPGLI